MSWSHTNGSECSPFHSKGVHPQSKPQCLWQHIFTTTSRYPPKTGPWRKTKSAVDWRCHCFWTFSVCCDNRRCDHTHNIDFWSIHSDGQLLCSHKRISMFNHRSYLNFAPVPNEILVVIYYPVLNLRLYFIPISLLLFLLISFYSFFIVPIRVY